jgi:hypothetical protein
MRIRLPASSCRARNIGQHQTGALVRRRPPSESERERVEIQAGVGLVVHVLDQRLFVPAMSVPHLFTRQADRVAQAGIVRAPTRDVPVEELPDRLRGPRRDVNPVGNRIDPVVREHVLRYFPVPLGNAVDVMTVHQGKVGKIELPLMAEVLLQVT